MAKTSTARSGKRREELRRTLPRPTFSLRQLLDRPDVVSLTLILVGFVITTSAVVVWSRDQVKVRDGQVMTSTLVRRLDYVERDLIETERQREDARNKAPQIWEMNGPYLEILAGALNGLPKAVAGKASLEEIDAGLRADFGLDGEGAARALAALGEFVVDGDTSVAWRGAVQRLLEDGLPRAPLLSSSDFQARWAAREYSNLPKTLIRPGGERRNLRQREAFERGADPEVLRPIITRLAAEAGFAAPLDAVVAARILKDGEPTVRFNTEETAREAEAAATRVAVVTKEHKRGEVIYVAGDLLTPQQYQDVLVEQQRYDTEGSAAATWLPRFGVLGLMTVLGLFVGVYIVSSYPRITRNPLRASLLLVLMVGMLVTSIVISVQAPAFTVPAAVAPTLVVAVLLLLAYDARLAVFLGGLQCAIVTLALDQHPGMFIVLLSGSVTIVALLREVRNRTSLTRAAVTTSVVLGIAVIVQGLLVTPVEGEAARAAVNQILLNGLYAALVTTFVGFLVLGVLPGIERLFDITTGMTLAELRDPRQPLLRQLQQKAPGTYNHSLQVANIAEAAAEAIGADGMLVYVGSLYHDIGKMNKPEYFVENQAGGQNKHDKLSPAMSLLIILGHVKDGVELAREYGLPRSLIHFIEAHHGTTLVEYFYHAARSRAAERDEGDVAEVEFRYPGPKPRTKEVAILMLSDAVESATRAMGEPNPARIEGIVRELSRKRLLDGQFDQCDLTFRELGAIEDAMISRLCAVHHGRISYPRSRVEEDAARREAAQSA